LPELAAAAKNENRQVKMLNVVRREKKGLCCFQIVCKSLCR